MITIVEYLEKYDEDVKRLLVQLQKHLVDVDYDNIQVMLDEYKEGYFNLTMDSIAKKDGKMLLALEDGKVIGMIVGIVEESDEEDRLINRKRKTGRILEFVVDKDVRGGGIGKKLISEMEEYLKGINCEYIMIHVLGPNKSALEFYNKNGYNARNLVLMKRVK